MTKWHTTEIEDFNLKAWNFVSKFAIVPHKEAKFFLRIASRRAKSQACGTRDPTPDGTPRNFVRNSR
jgi:hypothetical protein